MYFNLIGRHMDNLPIPQDGYRITGPLMVCNDFSYSLSKRFLSHFF
jgi:hypothetical protein